MHPVGTNVVPIQETTKNTFNEIPGMKRTHFTIIDSTQTQAKKQIETLEPHSWLLFTANEQTHGRGQHDRRWTSPPNVNVLATYAFTLPTAKSSLLFHIPQVATVAVAKTIECFGFHPQIKWINDLLVNNKKICGILSEATNLCKTQDYLAVLCGIGINVNMSARDCQNLDQPGTSLFVESGKLFDKEAVLEKLSSNLYQAINQLLESGFAPFQEELNQRLAFLGEKVTIELPYTLEKIQGVFEKVDASGQMILQLDTGERRTLHEGRILR